MFYYILLYLYIQRTTSLIFIYNNHKLQETQENGSADRVSDDNYIQHYYTSEKPSCLVRGSRRVQWGRGIESCSVSAYAASETRGLAPDKTGVMCGEGHQYLSAHDHAHLPHHHRRPSDHQLRPRDTEGGGQSHRDPGRGHGAQGRRGGSGQPRVRVQRLVCVPAHPQPPRRESFYI